MPSHTVPLGPGDQDAVRKLLTKDVRHNLYLLGLWEDFHKKCKTAGCQFLGRFTDDELKAVLFVGGSGGLMVPSVASEAELPAFAQALRGQVKPVAAVGEKPAVEALLKAFGARPRFVGHQRLFSVSADDLGPFTNPTLRLAREEDLPRLVPLAAGAVREVMQVDPLAEDADGFRARVLSRLRQKRTYVLEVDKVLVFKIDVGSKSRYGAELEGLYTLPEQRRMGHATLSLGQISRHLLSSLPRLTLRVDDKDPSLAGVARRVGFVAGRAVQVALSNG